MAAAGVLLADLAAMIVEISRTAAFKLALAALLLAWACAILVMRLAEAGR